MNQHWHSFFNIPSYISTIIVFCVGLKVSTSALSPIQFEPFIWSTMRQRQTPTFRSGTWQSWSWAATGAIWTGQYSCASGKPLTGLIFGHPYLHRPFCLSLNLLCLCLANARNEKILPFDIFSLFFLLLLFRYMVKHKSHLRFWARTIASISNSPTPLSPPLDELSPSYQTPPPHLSVGKGRDNPVDFTKTSSLLLYAEEDRGVFVVIVF